MSIQTFLRAAHAGARRPVPAAHRLRRAPLIGVALAAAMALNAHAADPLPEDDLPPVDDAPATAPTKSAAAPGAAGQAPRRDWTLTAEAAAFDTSTRFGLPASDGRLSLDFRVDKAVAPGWRAVLAHRVDSFDAWSSEDRRTRGMLKEAYVRWQAGEATGVELGRVNLRLGSAMGYNPTDFFKARAVPTQVSLDPDSRRRNRLGSVMLRAEQLWQGGAASLVLSPRLASERAPAARLEDDSLSRTNGADRALFSVSQQLSKAVQLRGVTYQERGRSAQWGVDASALVNDATVVYAEWGGGRSPSLIDEAVGRGGARKFHSRGAAGVTVTLPFGLTWTLEAQANRAAPTTAQWRLLALADPLTWARAQQWAADAQELPTRRAIFSHWLWRDAFVRRLDLQAFVQADEGDARQWWTEARYRFDRFDLALRWQRQSGPAWSRFGAAPERRSAQLIATAYF